MERGLYKGWLVRLSEYHCHDDIVMDSGSVVDECGKEMALER